MTKQLLIIFLAIGFASCEKETPSNGSFDVSMTGEFEHATSGAFGFFDIQTEGDVEAMMIYLGTYHPERDPSGNNQTFFIFGSPTVRNQTGTYQLVDAVTVLESDEDDPDLPNNSLLGIGFVATAMDANFIFPQIPEESTAEFAGQFVITSATSNEISGTFNFVGVASSFFGDESTATNATGSFTCVRRTINFEAPEFKGPAEHPVNSFKRVLGMK